MGACLSSPRTEDDGRAFRPSGPGRRENRGAKAARAAAGGPRGASGLSPSGPDLLGFDPSVASSCGGAAAAAGSRGGASHHHRPRHRGSQVGAGGRRRRTPLTAAAEASPAASAGGGGLSDEFGYDDDDEADDDEGEDARWARDAAKAVSTNAAYGAPAGARPRPPPPCPFGPRPDVSRPLDRPLLGGGKTLPDDIAALYDPGPVLGRGQFGVAREATCRRTGRRVAVKTIKKGRLRGLDTGLVDVRREVEVLRHLSPHPRIVRLLDALEDDRAVHLVLELCPGGELVDAVSASGRFTERDAASVMRALLAGVAYCHEMGVCHRDIKLDNLLIGGGCGGGGGGDSNGDGDGNGNGDGNDGGVDGRPLPLSARLATLKANDFGLSRFVADGEMLNDVCGTCFYIAPEILEGRGYDGKRADVWACGVIAYILLSGVPPFYAERDEDVMAQILRSCSGGGDGGAGGDGGGGGGGDDGDSASVPSFADDPVWRTVSPGAVAAIRRMMAREPSRRPTAREMLADPWVRGEGGAALDTPAQPEVLRRMRNFSQQNRLRREAMLLVAESMPPGEVQGLRALFDELDADGDGLITADELRQGLLKKGLGAAPREELERVIGLADVDRDCRLSVDEFLASTLDICRAGLRQRLEAAFARFDADGDGFATRREVGAALAALQGRRKTLAAARAAAAGGHDDDGGDDQADDDDYHGLEQLTRAERHVLDADVDAVFAEADADGDGRISREEFFAMMERPLQDQRRRQQGQGRDDDDPVAALGAGISRGSLAAARRQHSQSSQTREAPPPVAAFA